MDTFQWDDCFVTGLGVVDEQHHVLVDIINRFGDMLSKPDGSSRDDIERVFAELADYARFHFGEEEATMRSAGIDERHVREHCAAHARFLADVTEMHAAPEHADRESASKLLAFLTSWLACHILDTDQKMTRLLTAIKEGRPQAQAHLSHTQDKDPATAMLLRSVTTLFNVVSERNRALLELNQTLEARIESRTSELVSMNRRLENMAMTDVLTGLPNRRHAMRCLEQCWGESTRAGTPMACMMIDADGFKTINDSYGHEAGDEVLRQLARCLQYSVRNDDIVCRLGGDEFLILCDHTALSGAMTIADKLRREVSALRVPAGHGVWQGSVSVGVAERTRSLKGFDDLLKIADSSVYLAKRNGRNCVATAQVV